MLKLESLTTCYNTVPAVQNANLTVNDGAIVGIIGLNGAGKTTLMNTIAGITPAHTGRIILDGKDITKTKSHDRVKLGISLVPEGRHLFSDMTVLENLKTVTDKNDEIQKVQNLFPEMQKFLHKKAGKLSGGQQQMVAFSRAILAKPKLLLLDEVTMGLSPKLVADVFDTIYNIGRNFSKIIITGQETERILRISNRVYLMKTGHISECEMGFLKSEKIF